MFFPGTGKTRTIVGAILEIIESTEKCVLVTASSNAACDEIAQRLVKLLKRDQIFRLYAQSHDRNKVPQTIAPISNLRENFKLPSLLYLYQYRVVVCTLLTAGNLTRARGKDDHFDSKHFGFVIIDEAACAQCSALMVPIAGNYIILNCFHIDLSQSHLLVSFYDSIFRAMHRCQQN